VPVIDDEPRPKLLKVEECVFTNVATIRTQIKLRRGIQATLVGNLYPSILESEIEKLEELLRRDPMYELTIRRPDDFHVHLRQGSLLEKMVPATASYFRRALVMPNTTSPILDGQKARDYRAQIKHIADSQLDTNWKAGARHFAVASALLSMRRVLNRFRFVSELVARADELAWSAAAKPSGTAKSQDSHDRR
jgi:hypothetical protein